MNFFIDLFTSSNPSVPNNFKDLVTPSLSHEDFEMLTDLPSVDEKKNLKVVFSVGSNNAPSLDGMSTLFFKTYYCV